MRGHMDFTSCPQCIKCGYNDLDWDYIDGNVECHKYEYIDLTCRRCGFGMSMDTKDAVKITPSHISPEVAKRLKKELNLREKEDQGDTVWT